MCEGGAMLEDSERGCSDETSRMLVGVNEGDNTQSVDNVTVWDKQLLFMLLHGSRNSQHSHSLHVFSVLFNRHYRYLLLTLSTLETTMLKKYSSY